MVEVGLCYSVPMEQCKTGYLSPQISCPKSNLSLVSTTVLYSLLEATWTTEVAYVVMRLTNDLSG